MERKTELIAKIEALSRQIADLKDEKAKLEKELQANQRNQSQVEDSVCDKRIAPEPNGITEKIKLCGSEKITLFRSLFRGRADVYPRYWRSKTTDKSGYSPVCRNEWNSDLCRKFEIKCSRCPHREFAPLTDEVIRNHLTSRHAIGIYPLLKSDGCYFLAVDFDGKGCFEDASAFRSVCEDEGVPVSVSYTHLTLPTN